MDQQKHDPNRTGCSVEHDEGCIMTWACMAASGRGSLTIIDDYRKMVAAA